MPRQPKPVNTLDQKARHISDRLDRMAPALADRLGPPPGSDRYTRRERDALWDTRDVAVNRDALYRALQAGLPEQDVGRFALFRMAPDLAQMVTATPLAPEQAAAVAALAEYPGRYVLTVGHSADPEAQIEFVAQEQKRAAKRNGMAEPALGPPTMPARGPDPEQSPGGY